jgi:hypothetical protein
MQVLGKAKASLHILKGNGESLSLGGDRYTRFTT